MPTAYCVKCHKKREMKNPKKTKLKNKRNALKGHCPECNTGMYRMMPN